MDDSAPITWLVGQIDTIVSTGAGAAAGAIANTITPLVSIFFSIYIMLVTINYLRGAESEPVMDFGLRMAAWAIIIGIGLNATNYANTVIPMVTGLGGDLANAITGGTVTAGALDQLALHYLDILSTGYDAANAPVFPFNIGPLILYFFKACLIILGLVPFLVAATIMVIIANVGSVMVAMVGPIFFGFLLFPATRQYFSAWLNTALSYALIPIFVAVVSLLSVGLSEAMLSSGGGTLNDTSLKGVFLASMGNLVLLFLLKQVASLASSLSAGGINAGMPGGLGSLARGISGFGGHRGRQFIAAGKAGAWMGRRTLDAFQRMRGNSIRKVG